MTSLTDKLKELGVQIGTSKVSPRHKTDRLKKDLTSAFPGRWESTSSGECFVIRRNLPVGFSHGSYKLSIPNKPEKLHIIQEIASVPAVQLSDFLFIDTETTGLSGGAGTYVFLIGAAKFIDGQIQFAQFFLQDPGQESSQLAALESFIASTRVIVSYNGKSFDLPRIKTRYRFHGWPNPFEDFYHLDLLHIARRIWKDHLPNCTLGELERQLLGLEREEHDIPGWEVSEYFFRYLQEGDPEPLKHVFYHNEVDVISLVALLGYIRDRLDNSQNDDRPVQGDLVSISKYLAVSGRREQAKGVLTSILPLGVLDPQIQLDGLELLGALYKKEQRFADAILQWKQAAELGSLESKIELAKFFEHRIADYQEAIHWTLSAIETNQALVRSGGNQVLQAALEHRLQRLKRKAVD
jgi:uncharacterized protein YprB with RNaseH-like and TPR domain